MLPDSPKNLRWTPFLSLFLREIKRFIKVFFQTIGTPLVSMSLYLLIFGVSIGREISAIDGHSYIAFLLPGLVGMAVLRNSFDNAVGSIITSKFCGEMEDFRIVPLSPIQIAWANGLAASCRGLLIGLITLIIGEIFCYVELGHFITFHSPTLLLIFTLLGGLAYANLGLAISMWAKTFDIVNSANMFVLLPLIYLGGVFFSLDQLHPFWQSVSQFNPLLYLINGVRYSMLGVADVQVEISLLVTFLSFVLFNFFAIRSLKTGSYHRW